MYELINLQL